jgi:hypothetical protein
VADEKPNLGPEAEIMARLRAITEEIRGLRRQVAAQSLRKTAAREIATASDTPKRRGAVDGTDETRAEKTRPPRASKKR